MRDLPPVGKSEAALPTASAALVNLVLQSCFSGLVPKACRAGNGLIELQLGVCKQCSKVAAKLL